MGVPREPQEPPEGFDPHELFTEENACTQTDLDAIAEHVDPDPDPDGYPGAADPGDVAPGSQAGDR